MDNYLTTKEAAAVLSVSMRHIQKLVADGQLLACKVGRCLRVSEASMEEYTQRNRVIPAAVPVAPASQYKPGDKLV